VRSSVVALCVTIALTLNSGQPNPFDHPSLSTVFPKANIFDRTATTFLNLPQASTMADYAYPKLPYKPFVAKRLGEDPELTELACKYLEDTGDDSLRAQISSLELHLRNNMNAGLKLLRGAKKARVLHNTLEFAKNLYKAKLVDVRKNSAESARKVLRWLEPDGDHAGDLELAMAYAISRLVVHVVSNWLRHHSYESRVRGRESLHFEVNISLIFEALEDHCNWSHEGFFLRGLLSCLKKKRKVQLQESDDEDTPNLQPMQKKPLSEASGSSTQEDELPTISTGRRAIRTQTALIVVSCTACEKNIPYGPHNPSQQCVACQRKARKLSAVYQQAPTPTAVMVAPTEGRFAATAIMIPATAQTTQVNSIEHSIIEKASHGAMVRDFAPTSDQALQLQSSQVLQSDNNKNETLEQRIGNMSDFSAEQEDENQGLKDQPREEYRECARYKCESEAAHDEIMRLEASNQELKARIQQLEQQT
jgi:hypothetical protein